MSGPDEADWQGDAKAGDQGRRRGKTVSARSLANWHEERAQGVSKVAAVTPAAAFLKWPQLACMMHDLLAPGLPLAKMMLIPTNDAGTRLQPEAGCEEPSLFFCLHQVVRHPVECIVCGSQQMNICYKYPFSVDVWVS